MKKIINGKRYNTDTAAVIAEYWNGLTLSDFRYCDEALYRTKAGAFFVHGKGGALSRWAVPVGTSGRQGGNDIQVVTDDEAREWLESHDRIEQLEELFGSQIIDG